METFQAAFVADLPDGQICTFIITQAGPGATDKLIY